MAGTIFFKGSNAMTEIDTSLKCNSEDVGWEFGALVNPSNVDRVKCKLCGKVLSGGIYRLKQHIAHIKGNAAPCNKSSDEDKNKCKQAIDEAQSKKKQKFQREQEVRQEVILEGDEEVEGCLGPRNPKLPPPGAPDTLGPMDSFASIINPDSSLSGSNNIRQQNINDALWKQRTHRASIFGSLGV
uniref:uncharacterized protein LOC105349353 n=1 Tax=Fragaria vesca subsp. vesca TaxID=101020 RepID=UPI0005C7FC43|nr:PREDICTED: uncharacterized protein LOC105349353 [Fragaria vesca subsp. vesca]